MAVQIPGIAQPYRQTEPAGPMDVAQFQGMQTQNALRDMQLQQGQQAQQQQNAMLQLAGQPGMRDAEGLPTPQFINALGAINPDAASKAATLVSTVRHQKAQEADWRAQADVRQTEASLKRLQLARDSAWQVYRTYLGALEGGALEPDAIAQAEAEKMKVYDQLRKQDSNTPTPGPFDPKQYARMIYSADEWVKQQSERMKQAGTLSHPIPVDDKLVTMERQADGSMKPMYTAPNPALMRAQAASAAASEGGKPLTETAKLNADLAAGRITQAQYDAAQTGKGADKPLTEAQAKGTAYAAMMGHATTVQDRLKKEGFTGEALGEQIQVQNAMGEGIPYVPGSGILQRSMSGTKAQEAAQAQMLWGEAALRFLTGAAATKEEIVRTAATYFPRSGDKPDVVKQKREARRAMEEAIRVTAGRGSEKIPAMPPSGATGEWKIEKVE